jgi:hypothetical protein
MSPKLSKLPFLLAVAISQPAAAIELLDGQLSINGFGSWGYGAANHGNSYDVAEPKGGFGDGEFALALTARLSARAVVGAQMRVSPENNAVFLDWLFGEWRFSDHAHLRLGVVKHPIGIFGEISRVGTQRPFFLLPQGLYGSTEFTGAGVQGVSLSGSLASFSGWSLNYDLYGGALELPVPNTIEKVMDPGSLRPGGMLITVEEKTKYIAGGRLVANTSIDGLDIRLSGYGTPVAVDSAPRSVIGASVQYVGDKFSARAEYFFFYENGDLVIDQLRQHTAYLETAYFITTQIQLGIRGEVYRLRLLNGVRSSLLDHHELAATFNYWFTPGLVVKLSVHAIDGNRFANPASLDDALLAGGLNRYTTALVIGTQFSF